MVELGMGTVQGRGGKAAGKAGDAFARVMAEGMEAQGTMRRSADGGYVTAFAGAPGPVSEAVAAVAGRCFRGRVDGPLVILEFPTFDALLEGALAFAPVPVPEGAFLDFSDLSEGTVAPDPESEAALHAVLTALGQVVGDRPVPGAAPAAPPAPVLVDVPSANPADHLLSDLAHALPALEAILAGRAPGAAART